MNGRDTIVDGKLNIQENMLLLHYDDTTAICFVQVRAKCSKLVSLGYMWNVELHTSRRL